MFPGRGEFEMLQKIIERRGDAGSQARRAFRRARALMPPKKPRPSEEVWKDARLHGAPVPLHRFEGGGLMGSDSSSHV